MQKAEPQHGQTQHQPAAKQGGGLALASPQGEHIAQLEAVMDGSPQVEKLAGLAAMMNSGPDMAAQRKLADMLRNGPRQVAQKKAFDRIHNSPHHVAQQKKFDKFFGTAQRVEEEEPLQGKFETAQRVTDEEPLQGKFDAAQRIADEEPLQGKFARAPESPAQLEPAEKKPNNTGLPDNLKSGIENLSGMSMDSVKVHYNSSQPAQLNALAYAQGSDIHVAPGQEQHLPHEAWHVVQQAQGRVRPTMQMKGGVPVNDDRGLEHEADVMGGKAATMQARKATATAPKAEPAHDVAQLATLYKKSVLGLPHWEVVVRGYAPGESAEDGKAMPLQQIGFANPTAIPAMSGSVSTKSGSPSGFGGEGEVHWTELRGTSTVKGGYAEIAKSANGETDDPDLLEELPRPGIRQKYRLTSQNCQHFIVNAWKEAGLAPDIEHHLTLSEQSGQDINSGLLGGVGALGGLALGGATLVSLPAVGAVALGALAGVGLGRLYGRLTGKKKR